MRRCSPSSIVWVSSALALSLWAGTAVAQDSELPQLNLEEPCAPEVTEHRRGVAVLEDVPALWFHREVARCLLDRLRVLPLYVDRVRLLEQRLTLADERDALRARQVALAEEGEQEAVNALEAAVRGRREAEEALDAWYRHPAFWFVSGVVVTVALEIVAVWAFHQLNP